jgi:hypothetical protein
VSSAALTTSPIQISGISRKMQRAALIKAGVMQSGPRAPQVAHSTAVAYVPGSRKKRRLRSLQKGQGRGGEGGFSSTHLHHDRIAGGPIKQGLPLMAQK